MRSIYNRLSYFARHIFLFISFMFLMGGCASTLKVSYESDVGDPDALGVGAEISVRINESNLFKSLKKPETKQSIINAVKSDLEINLFSFGRDRVDVRVAIEKMIYKSRPWGFFWYPFVIIGAPLVKINGEALVTLKIFTSEGTLISSYRSNKFRSNWFGLYYGWSYGVLSKGGNAKNALRDAMEDIKSQILNDKIKIAQAIQKEKERLVKRQAEAEDSAEDLDPPLITLIKPSISRGMKKVVREKTLTVRGRAVDRSGIYEVRINGISAQLLEDGNFWRDVNLLRGENQVEILAIDKMGNRATQQFTVFLESTLPQPVSEVTDDVELETGNYYALIIGINSYEGEWIPLQNAVHDARGVAEELATNYHFDQIIELYDEDATRANIIRKLEWLADNLNEEDNLLIYYSGHGEFKENLNKGYWVPVDSKSKSTVNYISNSNLQTFLSGIPAQHTLLVSDACFSGNIFRSRTETLSPDEFDNINRYYREVNKRMSRQALTSGGIEPVMDGGREGHSVFTYYFLKALKQNENKYFDAAQVFEQLKIPVANNSEQTPILQAVKNTGDEGGQFIFIRK